VTDGQLILVAGALLFAGLLASLLAGRIRLPGLVLFLGVGMLVGSEGMGWIHFDDYELARRVGIVALALILFEGGLASGWDEIRPVLGPAISLAVLGTLLTAVVTGLVAAWLFHGGLLEGLLLGAILASTDGAAVFAVLRGSTLRRRLARTLEGEAGLNDPVAVLLVLGFISWLTHPGYGLPDMLVLFVRQLGIGLGIGLAAGAASVWALKQVRLASAGLYPVASIATAALAFGAADSLHGSGFLAVYVAGLAIGSASTPAQRTITSFHDGLAWVAQLTMFLTLGLLVFPSQLGSVAVEGLVIALVVACVARPLATFVATLPFGFDWRERVVLGWAGLRGAVPVVLATFAVTEHAPDSLRYFNVVFFAVLLSTVLQGSTFESLARALRVTTNEAALPRPLVERSTIRRLGAEVAEFAVGPRDAVAGALVRELGLPRDALLNVIVREEQAIPPRGSTRIEPGDHLHVLVRQEVAIEFRELLERWRSGPIGRPERRHPVLRGSTIFSTRPWTPDDGDPSRPSEVGGHAVVEQIRTRRDRPGALVALADGRFAYTGKIVAVGSASALQGAARRRLAVAGDEAERAWWREVIGALATP
jgi:potassium/hydrogen antiporter